ncbi:MAG: hypothetical protein L3J68_03895 [Thermoplasmata archaeon]|nr:hypothetical protein [Thermoplasmata archaeon]
MATPLELLNATFIAVLAAVGLLLLAARSEWAPAVRRMLERLAHRWATAFPAGAWDWRLPALGAAAVYVGVVAFDFVYGLYGCSGPPGSHDLVAYLASGRALLAGGNPFVVADCGSTIVVPYGIAAMLLNAVGSLGGLVGVTLVWGAVTVAVIPLTWWAAGPDRRYVTWTVAASVLFLPLAVNQVDGASDLMVPAAVLLALVLVRRGGPVAAVAGGFLATGRFPTLFPVVGATGRFPRPWWSGVAALATFGAVGGCTYLAFGRGYVTTVFVNEVARRSSSLNFYGILLLHGWLPNSIYVEAVQGALALALVAVVWWKAPTAVGAAGITLTGVALLTPFLSFNILCWLLPVALVGARARMWLWAIGILGTANYYVAFLYWGRTLGVWWPYELLDLALTACLLGLFVDLWRTEPGAPVPVRSSLPGPVTSA